MRSRKSTRQACLRTYGDMSELRSPRRSARLMSVPSSPWKAILFFVVTVLFFLSPTFFYTRKSEFGHRPQSSAVREDWDVRRNEVRNAFIDSWDAYAEHAWGYDRFHPVSQTGSQMSPNGLGWIIVDSLDTLMLMNLTSRLAEARQWVSQTLNYNQEQDVNTFETTIRMLGGLLSAHYLSERLPDSSSTRDYVYLEKAIELADRLLGAYDSYSGVPFASVDLKSGRGIRSHADMGASSTAEATTLQMEMKYLSNLTGSSVYWRKVEKIMKVIDDQRPTAGLVPIFIDPQSGLFTTPEIRLGSRGDSYYEYLIKQYQQTSQQEPIYSEMWQEALLGIQKHLMVPAKNGKLKMIAELPEGIGGPLSPKMDHLVCFLPGAIALGATNGLTEKEACKLPTWTAQKGKEMQLARELTKSCWAMYAVTETHVAPEIVFFHTDGRQPGEDAWRSSDNKSEWKADFVIKPLDAHNLQRPETIESLFVMWRITEDPKHRRWGWQIFQAFQKHSAVRGGKGGYTSLHRVDRLPSPQRDNMESFWLAETLKYLYLLFSPAKFVPLTEVVFNTEAHIFPKIELGKFSTGWQRRR